MKMATPIKHITTSIWQRIHTGMLAGVILVFIRRIDNHPNYELRDTYYALVPSRFEPFDKKHNKHTSTATNNEEQFWK